jgi:hypothetical protein
MNYINNINGLKIQINKVLLGGNTSEKYNTCLQCINYFTGNKQEFFDFSNDEIFEIIENLFEEISGSINDDEWKKNKQSIQILLFTLLILIRMKRHSSNVRYVEAKLKFYNSHPAFMLWLLIQVLNEEIKELDLFSISGNQYFVKVFEIMSAEVLVTPFLDKIQPLLYNHSKNLFESNHFSPFYRTNEIELIINKIEDKLLFKLGPLFFD